jgi:hypothetical protein
MNLSFEGEVIEWRGPPPYLFVAVPDDLSRQLKAISAGLTYGWGVIPVTARCGQTVWNTSLFPKLGRYLVPIKTVVQRAEGIAVGNIIDLAIEV